MTALSEQQAATLRVEMVYLVPPGEPVPQNERTLPMNVRGIGRKFRADPPGTIQSDAMLPRPP